MTVTIDNTTDLRPARDNTTGLRPARDNTTDLRPARGGTRNTVVVSGVISDSHTWNLVFLQLLIEEEGLDVVNLGPCTPEEVLVGACDEHRPALVVMSSVNGHGYHDGMRMIRSVRSHFAADDLPVVIGGKLGITGTRNDTRSKELTAAGFTSVFDDGPAGLEDFRGLLHQVFSAAYV